MQRRLRYLFLCMFTLLHGEGRCSAFEALLRSKNDAEIVTIAEDLSEYYIQRDLDTLRMIAAHLIQRKESGAFISGLGYRLYGSYFIRKGEISNGILCLNTAYSELKNLGISPEFSVVNNELGNAHYLEGNFSKAIRYYSRSVRIGEELNDAIVALNGMIGLGKAYYRRGDTILGEYLLEVFLSRALIHGKYTSASDAASFLGEIYDHRGDVELMTAYYERSLRYAQKSTSLIHLSNACTQKAILFFDEMKDDSAQFYFEEALHLRRTLGYAGAIIEGMYNLAGFYWELGEEKKATSLLMEADEMAEMSNLHQLRKEVLLLLRMICTEREEQQNIFQIDRELERIEKQQEAVAKENERYMKTLIPYARTIAGGSGEDARSIQRETGIMLLGTGILLFVGILGMYFERKPN